MKTKLKEKYIEVNIRELLDPIANKVKGRRIGHSGSPLYDVYVNQESGKILIKVWYDKTVSQ